MNKIIQIVLLFGLVGLGHSSSAFAINLEINVVPANQTFSVGDSFTADIVVSDLNASNEIVSAVDLDISYDAAIMGVTSILFDTSLGFSIQDDILSSGLVELAEISLELDSVLDTLQGDSVKLASLFFDAVSEGVGNINLLQTDVVGRNGQGITFGTIGSTSVTVSNTIPNVGTLMLMLTGVIWLSVKRVFRLGLT